MLKARIPKKWQGWQEIKMRADVVASSVLDSLFIMHKAQSMTV
jgi:hypothetical protein